MSNIHYIDHKKVKEEKEHRRVTGSDSKEIYVFKPLDIISDSKTFKEKSFFEVSYLLIEYLFGDTMKMSEETFKLIYDETSIPICLFVQQTHVKDIYDLSDEELKTYRDSGLLYSKVFDFEYIYPLKQIKELFG